MSATSRALQCSTISIWPPQQTVMQCKIFFRMFVTAVTPCSPTLNFLSLRYLVLIVDNTRKSHLNTSLHDWCEKTLGGRNIAGMMSGWMARKFGHVTRIPHPVSPYWLEPACRRLRLGSIKYIAETGVRTNPAPLQRQRMINIWRIKELLINYCQAPILFYPYPYIHRIMSWQYRPPTTTHYPLTVKPLKIQGTWSWRDPAGANEAHSHRWVLGTT